MTPFRRFLYLDAASYCPERLFQTSPASVPHVSGQFALSPKGKWAYVNRIVPEGTPLSILGKNGFVAWDGDVVIPTLVDMSLESRTGLRFEPGLPEEYRATWGAVWMSLTPAEMLTQRSGIRAARGTVLVGGLGLGWFLRKVCEKDLVERVIVVEKSRELLDWYGARICGTYSKVSDVICDDVYNQIGKHGPTQYLLDIWPVYGGAHQDSRLKSVRRRLGKRFWAWGVH